VLLRVALEVHLDAAMRLEHDLSISRDSVTDIVICTATGAAGTLAVVRRPGHATRAGCVVGWRGARRLAPSVHPGGRDAGMHDKQWGDPAEGRRRGKIPRF
jgi:hypothetical protein